MTIDKPYLEGMIQAAKQEQEKARQSFTRQEGVIAFCEMMIKSLEEEDKK